MKMLQAIAESAGNKARARNDEGKPVIVQQRYASMKESWYHVWFLSKGDVIETDLGVGDLKWLWKNFQVDPDEDYWRAV